MRLWDAVLEVVSPTRCAGCDLPGELFCTSCLTAMVRIESAWVCERCGAPFGHITCTECWDQQFAFEALRCVGVLERPLSRMVTLYKDGGERRLAALFAELLCSTAEEWLDWADLIVVVPASPAAVRRRGFDHMRLVGEAIASRSGHRLADALQLCGSGDQRTRGREARRTAADGAWRAVFHDDRPDRVLLFDDVVTTCATTDSASAALLDAGAAAVRVAALARAW